MSESNSTAATLLEAVEQSLLAAGMHHKGNEVAPAAILWTDADGQWMPVVEQLRGRMPQLLTRGEYEPEGRIGPAIWLKCVIESAVREEHFPNLEISGGAIPVIYLPNVSRQTLRAVEECPDELKPLVELQYRGTVWMQKNGRDWTVRAFLVSDDGGLSLDVAEDTHTRAALHGSLQRLATTPLSELRGKRLEAEDFNQLMTGDPVRNLLQWLSDPDGTRERWSTEEWQAFRQTCLDTYKFDPANETDIDGGQKLGACQGLWKKVWERYEEAPSAYPGIPDLLRRAKGSNLFPENREYWPDETERDELALRAELLELEKLPPAKARTQVVELEAVHGPRRDWVWARLGMSPLATAMEHLAALANHTTAEFGGASIDEMVRMYVEGKYLADDAVLHALASVKKDEDCRAVTIAIRSIYSEWLDNSARHLQSLISQSEYPALDEIPFVEAKPGECLLFVDGLRYDLGQRLATMADSRQLEAVSGWRWAAIPTVTATSKPAASPVRKQLAGAKPGQTYSPQVAGAGQILSASKFRQLLQESGYQLVETDEPAIPDDTDARGWSEYGEFDKLGHNLNVKLAYQVPDQLELLLDRIDALLHSGWNSVRVVTDHGWLLMPGALPVTQLANWLTESKWSRCASIKANAVVEVPYTAWSWNPQEHIALAEGVSCFKTGREYAHGGISLQECCTPDIAVSLKPEAKLITVSIEEERWVGLRYRLRISPPAAELVADLRTKPADPASSVTQPKAIDSEGRTSLIVADDSLEGTAVNLVILDPSGRVMAKRATTIGEDG